jgi:glycosyltransferase involved in cell wall biosynthesis
MESAEQEISCKRGGVSIAAASKPAKRGSKQEPAIPQVSCILCTYQPRPDILQWAFESLAAQSLDKHCYEVILVDNNCDPPLDPSDYAAARDLPLRLVRESRQGLIHARTAGIRVSRAPILVFLDDDNRLDPNYFAEALRIAREEPEIGLFGGSAKARLEQAAARWKGRLLPYLGVRDYGSRAITSHREHWGWWEPIGAGMVARREVAEAFARFVETNAAADGLGRKGRALMSCEDSLFARLANRAGFACSYQPSLQLEHFIKKQRLHSGYLFRLLMGLGRSYVRLERIVGRSEELRPIPASELVKRLAFRLGKGGLAGLVQWAWDLGYYLELGRGSDRPSRPATQDGDGSV